MDVDYRDNPISGNLHISDNPTMSHLKEDCPWNSALCCPVKSVSQTAMAMALVWFSAAA